MRLLVAHSCLAMTAAALMPLRPSNRHRHQQQRSTVVAQHQQPQHDQFHSRPRHDQQPQQAYTPQDWYVQQADAQPASPWTTAVDPSSGVTYYYNEQTGQARWDPPHQAHRHEGSHGGAQMIWRVASVSGWGPMGSAGRYTLRTGRCHLIVLGRYDMELHAPRRPYVSRRQCEVQLQADGTITLTSTGQPPTLWRPRDRSEWVALNGGDWLTLTDGDQVSVDAHDPESTVFTCNGFMEQQDDYAVATALNDVAMAEERLRLSSLASPCNGPSMEALEALEAADHRLAAEEQARYDLQ